MAGHSSSEATRAESLRTLGEHLIGVLRRRLHDIEDSSDEFGRDLVVEQIAHGVDEDGARRGPPLREVEGVRMEGETETGSRGPEVTVALILRHPHGLQPLGQGQGIAVVAARRRPIASGGRVPRCFGPLDTAAVPHLDIMLRGCRTGHRDDLGGAERPSPTVAA